jgi:hypothetical protein
MVATQEWKIIIVTTGKIYGGNLSCNPQLQDKRTLSFLNSTVADYMDKHSLKGYILLKDVSLLLNSEIVFTVDKALIKKSEIIFVYDEYKQMGSDIDRKRFYALQEQRSQATTGVNIVTSMAKDSFYNIKGEYKGAFKEIIARQFVPLVNVEIEEIFEKDGKVCKKKQKKNPFIALNKDYIESILVID